MWGKNNFFPGLLYSMIMNHYCHMTNDYDCRLLIWQARYAEPSLAAPQKCGPFFNQHRCHAIDLGFEVYPFAGDPIASKPCNDF